MNNTLSKVSAFITREMPHGRELLVFDQEFSFTNIQVPAGTVEPDEESETAVLRETFEESGLSAVRIVQTLDTFVSDIVAGEGWYALIQPTPFRQAPVYDAPLQDVGLGRGTMFNSGAVLNLRSVQGEWAEVMHEVHDRHSNPPYQAIETVGWIPANLLASHLSRTLYHLITLEPTPETWEQLADGYHHFRFYWLPLVPRPHLSIWQDPWLDRVYDRLLAYQG